MVKIRDFYSTKYGYSSFRNMCDVFISISIYSPTGYEGPPTRLCRPRAEVTLITFDQRVTSCAGNLEKGGELASLSTKRTHTRSPNGDSLLARMIYPPSELLLLLLLFVRTRSFDHVVRTLLAGLTCLTCISNLVVYNKFPTWMGGERGKSECFSSGILSSNEKVRLNYLIGVSRSFAFC